MSSVKKRDKSKLRHKFEIKAILKNHNEKYNAQLKIHENDIR